jgi:hypothetical protein
VSASQANADAARLTGLGFVAGVSEPLSSSGNGAGLSIAEQFGTSRGASGELSHQVQMTRSEHGTQFAVSEVPHAEGLQLSGPQGPGYNVAFVDGDCYYLVGAVGSKAATRANVILGAQHLYSRVHH